MCNNKLYSHIKEIPENLIRDFESKNKHSEKNADRIMNDQIVVRSNYKPIDFSTKYDWDCEPQKNSKTFQLYLQSLQFLNDLIISYYESEDIEKITKIDNIISSWLSYEKSNPVNEMLWYDHPTAVRSTIITQFIYLAVKADLDIDLKKYFQILEKHILVLTDSSNYNYNNHGLMMDKSLLLLGNFLNRESLLYTGISRSTEAFWYNYSSNGIHLENSPEYHLMVTRIYKKMQKYLELCNHSYSEYILTYLKMADNYFNILVRPDGYLPSIGDSNELLYSLNEKQYNNLNDSESGMNIYQRNGNKPLYLTFVCGYSSRVHKHLDDLSITLNYNYKNYFVDPGKFNYSSSPIRKYMLRETSHSTLYLKKMKYKRVNENRFSRLVRTNGYYHGEHYSILSGINESLTNNAVLTRKIIIFNHYDVIILLDKSNVDGETGIVQNFNLHQDVIVKKNGQKVILRNHGEAIEIEQFLSSNIRLVDGEKEDVIAKNTIDIGKTINTKQIQFSKKVVSKGNYDFITAINLNNYKIEIFEKDSNIFQIYIDKKMFIINF